MCSMPGIVMSPAYLRRPETLLGVSMRRTFFPMKSPCSTSSSRRAATGRLPFCTSRQLDRVKNLLVTGAATDIAAKPLLDLLAVGKWIRAQRGRRCHYHTWNAVAALACARLVESLLQYAEFVGPRQRLDRL